MMVKHMKVWLLECKAPSQKAFVLGIIALVCLAAAHIFAVMIGCSISNIVKVLAVPKISAYINMACLSLTWIVAIAGAGILTMGIWTNRESRSKCGFTNKHFLSFGGKVCFFHAFVSVVFYLTTIISKRYNFMGAGRGKGDLLTEHDIFIDIFLKLYKLNTFNIKTWCFVRDCGIIILYLLVG
ncbi:hypothetical protein Bca52824_061874 [Brassica carinata]|uniref:Uncharacterized protein n=1 Tax=Brassica carinata TaxID=52824 RepID=A0A8X7QBM9_BRACI|nr:hypothetical protein Bca52824_061874 [Brassica carinata]